MKTLWKGLCSAWSRELALGRDLCFTLLQMKKVGKPSGKSVFSKGGVWLRKEQSTGTFSVLYSFTTCGVS